MTRLGAAPGVGGGSDMVFTWRDGAPLRGGGRGERLTMSAKPRVARRPRPEPEDEDEDEVMAVGSAEAAAAAAEARRELAGKAKAGFDEEGKKLKWMEILEESAEYDPEIKDLLEGVNGDSNKVEERIRERFEKRKERVYQEREGSTVPMLVQFGEFKSHNLWIWVEAHNSIAEMEQPLLDEVFKAWFVLGKLGGYNTENMQVQANFFEVSNMDYDMEQANGSEGDVPTCVFHAMVSGKWANATRAPFCSPFPRRPPSRDQLPTAL